MKLIPLFLMFGATLLTVGCGQNSGTKSTAEDKGEAAPAAPAAPEAATAEMKNAKGDVLGTIRLTAAEAGHGVRLAGDLKDLPPGIHGFHIHMVGQCEAPDFKSAGGHFNPTDTKHSMDTQGGHAGDLGNITVNKDGTVAIDTVAHNVSLGEGSNSLFHPGGTSVMVHADADDLKSDPAGNAGARIACGVVTR
jgi:Cu-Zn family superoxide dismutase